MSIQESVFYPEAFAGAGNLNLLCLRLMVGLHLHIPLPRLMYTSVGLVNLKKVKDIGELAILDRGSSHAAYNKRILAEEYNLQGIEKWLPPDAIIRKELREYELADYILVPSNFVRRSFVEQGMPESKLITIPYGINLDSFYPTEIA